MLFEMKDGTQFRTKLIALGYYDQSSKQYKMLQKVQKVDALVEENKIRYPNVFPGIDLEYEYMDTQLKERLFLSQAARDRLPDPRTLGMKANTTYLVFLTQFETPDSLEAFTNSSRISTRGKANRLIFNYQGEAEIEFRSTNGKRKYLLPPDFVFAMASMDSSANEENTRRMWRQFFSSSDKNFILTGVPVHWLQSRPGGTLVFDPTVSLTPPTDDVWIEYNKSYNYNTYNHIRIGRQTSWPWKRSLVRFDLSGIPQPATIQSATLQLYFYRTHGGTPVERTVQCHQVLKEWNESQATWYNRLSGSPWGTPGVGFDNIDAKSSPEDSDVWGSEYPCWKSFDITELIQRWVSGTDPNYGVILWATNESQYTDRDEKWCYSSEYSGDVSKRPKLVVTYALNPLAEFEYDALGRPTTIAYANGVTESNQYDPNRGWITRRDYQKDGTNLFYFNNTTYDNVGNLKQQEYKHKSYPTETMDYDYDDLYRLTQFKHNGSVSRNYDYDPNGNLITFTGKTLTYGNQNNQLTGDGSRTFHFDVQAE